jgi:hypothetical protein
MLCALSLLLVAFAHKPLVIPAAAYGGVEIADYVLPDGTLPDLCLTGEADDTHHSASNHCEACRIVSSVDLPFPFDGYVVNRLRSAAERTVPRTSASHSLSCAPALPRAARLNFQPESSKDRLNLHPVQCLCAILHAGRRTRVATTGRTHGQALFNLNPYEQTLPAPGTIRKQKP